VCVRARVRVRMSKLSRMCCVLLCGVKGRSAIVWVTETPLLTNNLELGSNKWHYMTGSLVLSMWQRVFESTL
jgi:hypothetical protein